MSYEVTLPYFKKRMISTVVGLSIAMLASFYLDLQQEKFLESFYGLGFSVIFYIIPSIIVLYLIYSSSLEGMGRRLIFILYTIFIYVVGSNNNYGLTESFWWPTGLIALLVIVFDSKIKYWSNLRRN